MKNGLLLFICHRCKCDHSRISEFSISLLIAVGRKRGFLCKKNLSHPCYDNCNASLHRQFLICFKPTTLWTAGNVRYTTVGMWLCAHTSVCVHVCVRVCMCCMCFPVINLWSRFKRTADTAQISLSLSLANFVSLSECPWIWLWITKTLYSNSLSAHCVHPFIYCEANLTASL